MTKYATIVYLTNYTDDHVENFLNPELESYSEDRMINYLSQWDNGEYHDVMDCEPWETADTVYKQESSDYILSYNTELGYVALTLKLEDDD